MRAKTQSLQSRCGNLHLSFVPPRCLKIHLFSNWFLLRLQKRTKESCYRQVGTVFFKTPSKREIFAPSTDLLSGRTGGTYFAPDTMMGAEMILVSTARRGPSSRFGAERAFRIRMSVFRSFLSSLGSSEPFGAFRLVPRALAGQGTVAVADAKPLSTSQYCRREA